MIRLRREGALSDADALSKARQWAALGYVRLAVIPIAWLAALMTLSITPLCVSGR